jgi:hypothetical protein
MRERIDRIWLRRVVPVALALCVLLGGLPGAASASTPVDGGDCGDSVAADTEMVTNGYSAATNTFHVSVTPIVPELDCSPQFRNYIRVVAVADATG